MISPSRYVATYHDTVLALELKSMQFVGYIHYTTTGVVAL